MTFKQEDPEAELRIICAEYFVKIKKGFPRSCVSCCKSKSRFVFCLITFWYSLWNDLIVFELRDEEESGDDKRRVVRGAGQPS